MGWLGGAYCMLVLGITGLLAEDTARRIASYELMNLFDRAVNIPLGMSTLVTGLVVSLRTKWGTDPLPVGPDQVRRQHPQDHPCPDPVRSPDPRRSRAAEGPHSARLDPTGDHLDLRGGRHDLDRHDHPLDLQALGSHPVGLVAAGRPEPTWWTVTTRADHHDTEKPMSALPETDRPRPRARRRLRRWCGRKR